MKEMPSPNGRFCEMAAVTPHQRQCELESYYPARSAVKPPPRKAAGTLQASREAQCNLEEKGQSVQTTIGKFGKVNDKNKNK